MAAIDGQCGLCEVQSKRAAFPLKMRYAQQWVSGKVVLMGDAAHTIHPLAGLGMNLGLKDAAYLIELLKQVRVKNLQAPARFVITSVPASSTHKNT